MADGGRSSEFLSAAPRNILLSVKGKVVEYPLFVRCFKVHHPLGLHQWGKRPDGEVIAKKEKKEKGI